MHVENINNFKKEVLEIGSYAFMERGISFDDIDDYSNRIKIMVGYVNCFWYCSKNQLSKLDKLLKSLPKEGSLYGKFKNPERISDVELSFHRNGITYHVFRKNIKGILIVPIEDKPSPGNSIYIK